MTESTGLVHVYTGNGKGKTTAAVGLAVRAAGHGHRVYIGQFLKGIPYGELALERFSGGLVEFHQFGSTSLIHTITDADRQRAEAGMLEVEEAVASGRFRLVILDEIHVAVHFDLVPVQRILKLMETRPKEVELVLTGRYAPSKIIDAADLVTEMLEVRHPFARGVVAREGIER